MAKKKRTESYVKMRTKVDVISTIIKDKDGNTVFDGRDLMKKKPRIGG